MTEAVLLAVLTSLAMSAGEFTLARRRSAANDTAVFARRDMHRRRQDREEGRSLDLDERCVRFQDRSHGGLSKAQGERSARRAKLPPRPCTQAQSVDTPPPPHALPTLAIVATEVTDT